MLPALALVAFVSNTWFIDVNGVPPGTGTSLDPYTDIQYAIDQPTTAHGDLLLVRPGTYVGNIEMVFKSVSVHSTHGPLATRLEGSVQSFGNHGVASVDGFWIGGPDAFLHTGAGSVSNCVVDGTQTPSGADGVFMEDSSTLRNLTVFGFDQGLQEFAFASSQSVLENVVIYGNTLDARFVQSCGNDVQYCVFGTVMGLPAICSPTMQIGVNPGLWSASDPHLAPLSICIDAGNPARFDPDGSRSDIGAIPYDPNYAPTPTTYCTPKTTSKGCAPLVTWTGSASLTGPDDFVLTASPALNKKVGKFVWGTAPKALPFAGGSLCVKLPFVRGPHLDSGGSATGSDCTGVFTWHFSQAYMASKGVTAGAILYAQAWGRDQGFAPPNNSQLSNAIVFQVAP
jgi:hypothetical protein